MPSDRLPSWKDVATTLALQLANHAYCDQHCEDQPCEGCPFCEDRIAYRLWERKAGQKPLGLEPVPTVQIDIRGGI